jgi:hypothetical protein
MPIPEKFMRITIPKDLGMQIKRHHELFGLGLGGATVHDTARDLIEFALDQPITQDKIVLQATRRALVVVQKQCYARLGMFFSKLQQEVEESAQVGMTLTADVSEIRRTYGPK